MCFLLFENMSQLYVLSLTEKETLGFCVVFVSPLQVTEPGLTSHYLCPLPSCDLLVSRFASA